MLRSLFGIAAGVLCSSAEIFPFPRYSEYGNGKATIGDVKFQWRAGQSARLDRGVDRYRSLLVQQIRSIADLSANQQTIDVSIDVASYDEDLGLDVAEDYELSFDATQVRIRASSIYGGLHAIESLSQLIEPCQSSTGTSACLPSSFTIKDSPSYSWRGLMLDTGRRFFPLDTVYAILDSMAASKLNVLHLHASDHCRFSVQSGRYPNLTDALVGILGGYYSQADIKAMVAYAGDRGIAVRPEFDIPGHSRCFIPLEPEGIQFCAPTDPTRSQLYGDPQNKTYNIITSLFAEMAALFPDPVFHIGSDETTALDVCTVPSTFALERAVLEYVRDELNKTPAGWEEVLFDAGAATNDTIVYAWSQYTPAQIINAGRRAIDSQSGHFYLTDPAPGPFPAGWANFWYDIGTGLNSTQQPMLLGGEAASWTDSYCYIDQCGSSTGHTPVGAALFAPEQDQAFSQSIQAMIFPRAFVAAASFWNYNASVSSSDPSFVSAINTLVNQTIARGGYACPVGCRCDQLSACGQPYIPGPVPGNGSALNAAACSDPVSVAQNWTLTADGKLMLGASSSLSSSTVSSSLALATAGQAGAGAAGAAAGPWCVLVTGYNLYPLQLGPCDGANVATWTHMPSTSELVHSGDGACLDLRTSDGSIGTYSCGSGSGLMQPNQQWVIDPVSGLVASLYDGECLTAMTP